MPPTRSARLAPQSSRPAAPAKVVVADRLGAFAGDWDTAVLDAPVPSPFLRSWWLAHVPADCPTYLLVVGADGLLGGVALDRQVSARMTYWTCLGGPLAADHLDLVARRGREPAVVGALRRWLRRPGNRLLALEGLAEGARLLEALPHPRVHRDEVAPYFRLPSADLESYLHQRPGRLRSSIERPRKRLVDRLGGHHRVVSAYDLDRGLRTLRDLHAERWGLSSPLLAAWRHFAAAAAAGAGRGEVQLHELVVPVDGDPGEQVVASDALLVVGDRVSVYTGGRSTDPRWRGAGSLLTWAELSLLAQRGAREFDFLRGDEPYKYDWADRCRPLLSVRAARGPLAVAALARREAPLAARDRLRPLARRLAAVRR